MTGISRKYLYLFALLLTSVRGFSQTVAENVPSNPDWNEYLRLLHSSIIDLKGAAPFQIKINFELYDLEGKPIEKGTIDLSWEAGTERLHVEAPSLRLDEPSTPGSASEGMNRETYLVGQLIKSIIRPLNTAEKKAGFSLDHFDQSFEALPFHCIASISVGTKRGPNDTAYCTDINERLRVVLGAPEMMIRREDLRQFRTHYVPMDTEISYFGKVAITGHVEELEPVPPSTDASQNAKSAGVSRVPAVTMEGGLITRPQPVYPKDAKKKRLAGTVLLCGVISKDGTMRLVDTLASSNSIFNQSAIDAVKQWVYRPYILDGSAVDVETTITVNYSIGK